MSQAKEAELKLRLDKLASLAILPGGYSKHSEAAITLSDEIIALLRGGRPTLAEAATKMVALYLSISVKAILGEQAPC